MKKFFYSIMFMLTLLMSSTVYSSDIPLKIYDSDVGIENVQIMSIDSVLTVDYQIKIVNQSAINIAKDLITNSVHKCYTQKYDPYKFLSIAKSDESENQIRQRGNSILYTINNKQSRQLEKPFNLMI